jgi:hypothetical protein
LGLGLQQCAHELISCCTRSALKLRLIIIARCNKSSCCFPFPDDWAALVADVIMQRPPAELSVAICASLERWRGVPGLQFFYRHTAFQGIASISPVNVLTESPVVDVFLPTARALNLLLHVICCRALTHTLHWQCHCPTSDLQLSVWLSLPV